MEKTTNTLQMFIKTDLDNKGTSIAMRFQERTTYDMCKYLGVFFFSFYLLFIPKIKPYRESSLFCSVKIFKGFVSH